MQKLKDILLLVAGLALLPTIADLLTGNVGLWIAGLGVGIAGLLGLLNK